jgi:hypothetical protein
MTGIVVPAPIESACEVVALLVSVAPEAMVQPLSSGVAGAGQKPSVILPSTLRLPLARSTSVPGSPEP